MDFNLTEEEKIFQASVRKFFEKELLPIVHDLEEAEEFPMNFYRLCGKNSLLGINMPEAYGGSDANTLTCSILIEEASRINAGIGGTIWTATMAAPPQIIAVGTEEQKEKYLKGITTGEQIIAFALTEPNAGSDAAGIQTTAKKDGSHYVINGNKTFITNGAVANAYFLVAYTDKSKGYKGMDVFLVDSDLPGITVTKKLNKLGWLTSETVELAFEDVHVPLSAKCGSKGLSDALELLNFGRIMMA
ncbi:MAG: acyl-CoA dehydrogenase family protein, partial [Thermodesulfobacteriota bacterium]|nr:acyl-CoA dehydrogenase family protein [Thermodesulfobacteriota bacterium]